MKLGVVGLGAWGKKVAREYIALSKEGKIERPLLCDTDSSRFKQFEGADTCNSISEMIGKVDGVHLCIPNALHHPVANEFLTHEVNVLVEKPMAENVADASHLLETALAEDLVLQVGHIFRFSNIVRTVKELYKQGTFGEVSNFNLAWAHMMTPIKNNDVIYDLLPHPIDILNFITNEWPAQFSGIGKAVRKDSTIDFSYLNCRYKSGKMANIYLSWVSHARKRTLEIVGSKKTFIGDCVKQEATLYSDNGEEKLDINPNNTIREEILNFVSAIRHEGNRHNSGIVGVQSVHAIQKAHDAIKSES